MAALETRPRLTDRGVRGALTPARVTPTLLAAALAVVYVVVSPPSLDLAAHLLRAKLFASEGFGVWNNWWYAGHHVIGYSVLFPPIAAAIGPQLAAALAAVATAALFEPLVRRHFGDDAWPAAVWFGAATAINLFTGRLTFAFGLLPAMGSVLALQRRRPWLSCALAFLTALASPVAALFAALAGLTSAIGDYLGARRIRPMLAGIGVALAALLPVVALGVVFPEGGSEPFTFATLWPILAIAAFALLVLPRRERTLQVGVVLYALGCIAAYAAVTPVGSNAARLGPLIAGPLAAAILWRRRLALLIAVAPALLYLQWQAPVRDVRTSADDSSASPAYYQPLLTFLAAQPGPPFRIEIPFTQFHWEAYRVAPRFSLARGWERQLDIKYNGIFYGAPLTAASYEEWLRTLAVRFVAVSDAKLDYSAHAETALINRGLPYLRLVWRSRHWRVYAVQDATSILQGAAALRALGPNSLTLQAYRPGTVRVRVRFTPYWAISGSNGCVLDDRGFVKLTLRRPGRVRLIIRFSLARIAASSPRCS